MTRLADRHALVFILVLVFAGVVSGAAGAPADLPQQRGTVDLLSQANVQIDGAASGDGIIATANAGDVNGDGRSDVVLGARFADNNGRAQSGSAYVVFGRSSSGTIDLAALGDAGFRIDGASAGDLAGTAVAGAGDVNGDGRADLVVGAPRSNGPGRTLAGSAYVVFGKASSAPVDLGALGAGGIRIDGAAAFDQVGGSVSGIGDVNADSRPDVLLGAIGADNNGRSGSGSAYVVFGTASTTPVDLAVLGSGGFRIDGATALDAAGAAVAGPGDVNGDGRPDVLVGASAASNNGRPASGSVYVVFGRTSTTPVDLVSLGTGGFRIDGAALGDVMASVAGIGDVNADGRADVLTAAPLADNNGRANSGSAYVVFGKTSTTNVDLAALGAGGFRIDGAAANDLVGLVAGPGDMNGDGRPDMAVGATGADANGRTNAGAAYVVFGKTTTATVDLATLGASGITIAGAAAGHQAGIVGGAGDGNGDGRTDLVVGAVSADNNGRTDSGSAYIVYGFGEPRLAYAPLQAQVGTKVEAHRPTQLARTGQPTFRVTPPLPAGLRLEGLGVISGTPTEAQPRTTHRVTMQDLAGEVSAELVLTVSPPPDTTPPRLVLRAVSPQPASRRGDVRVRATCNEPCTLRATGRVVIAGSQKLRLLPTQASLARAGGTTLVLRLTGAGTRRLSAATAASLRARAPISVRAVDGAGNATTKTTSVRTR